jgi:redox-sensing transcriptional repressor
LRELIALKEKGVETTSSSRMAQLLGVTDAQVRKDLAYFGQFGHPGVGYPVEKLISQLKRILGTDRLWDVVLIGCGNLGRALAAYKGFRPQGFNIVALFDVAADLIGQHIGEMTVQPMQELAETVARREARIAILCVPADQAQSVADAATSAGIRGILNFAATLISTPEGVVQNSVDLAIRLEQLSFQLNAASDETGDGEGEQDA